MNKRRLDIIHELSNLDKKFTISDLAERFNVSSRSIRNDLNAINETLVENGLTKMDLKRGGYIERKPDFNDIQAFLVVEDYYDYKLSREERIKIGAVMLVQSDDFITLSAIADRLFVSRATVIDDLPGIKKLVEENGMEVLSSPNKGQSVVGLESKKRFFLLNTIFQEREGSAVSRMMSHLNVQAGNMITVQKIINEQEHVHKSFLDDRSFVRLKTYLGIMIDRNMHGEYVEPQPQQLGARLALAQDILKYISQYCNIVTTVDEAYFLCHLLDRCRFIRKSMQERDMVKIQMITRQFVQRISNELEIDLNMDYDFFENLANHLEAVIKNTGAVVPMNDVVREIVEENEDIHNAVKKNMNILDQYSDRKFTEDELMFVTIHVCAAMERKKNREIVFHAIVVCHAGVGTSRLLLEKLKKHFNFRIVDVMSAHEAHNVTSDKADLVISTIDLKKCPIPYVVVSPMLNDEDYIRVGNKIDALRNSRNLPDRVDEKDVLSAKGLNRLLKPVIYEKLDHDTAHDLYKIIRRIVKNYFNKNDIDDDEIMAPYLHHLLPSNFIQLDVECADWQDAVRKSARKLIDAGYIEERYTDAMIANIEANGPYVVLSPGFAVPHEGIGTGSIRVGMNLIRLKHPVEFGSEDFDPVEFVCCLSAVDHKTHLKAFFNLVNMLSNTDFKDALRKAKTPEEAAMIIEQYEYTIGI